MDIPISRIRKIPETLSRYKHILAVLARYGLADWLDRLPVGFAREVVAMGLGKKYLDESPEERLREALTELGPLFIKLGQVLSTRPDVVGVKMSAELQRLQDDIPSEPVEKIRQTIEDSLGESLESLFQNFENEPIASASIAQVHKATLRYGQQVVVKVQHSNIEKQVQTDLAILMDLADLLEQYVTESRSYRPRAMAEEFRRTLLRELDFRREMHHMQAFRSNFSDNENICIPKAYPDYCSTRVLTMEYLEGIKATNLEALEEGNYDLRYTAEQGATAFLDMIFEDGLFHGDPHPGNFKIMESGCIALLDFGKVGRVDEDLERDLEDILIGITRRDTRRIIHALNRMGALPPDLDRGQFQADLNDFLGYYTELPLGEVNVANALRELLEIIRRHGVVLPSDLALLLTVVITLEGTGRKLDPSFKLMNLLEPYQKKVAVRRLTPSRQLRKLQRLGEDVSRLVETAPASLSELIRQLENGNFTFQLRIQEIEQTRKQVEQSTNRITFGILTASILLSSSLLMFAEVPPTLWGFSALGLAGYIVSLFFAIRLIWAIFRSGNLN